MSKASFINRIMRRLKTIRRKMRDNAHSINIKKQKIILSSAYFDEEEYLKNYPEVANFPAGARAHFFLHGIHEHKTARFFDSKWYSQNYPDVALSKYDNYGHYKASLTYERRNARFINIGAEIVKGINSDYSEWIKKYDSPNSEPHNAIIKACNNVKKLGSVSIICKTANGFDNVKQFENFLLAISKSYHKDFELILGVSKQTASALDATIAKYQNNIKIICKIYDANDAKSAIYLSLIESAKSQIILKTEVAAIIAPTLTYYCAANFEESDDDWLAYFDNDHYDCKYIREDHCFKPDFNYDLFLTNNYIGTTWSCTKKSLKQIIPNLNDAYDTDYSLILEFLKNFGAEHIKHIAKIGFHMPDGFMAPNAPVAVQKYLDDINSRAIVTENHEVTGTNRIKYILENQEAKVSIIIPTRDKVEILKNCVFSILDRTQYKNYEIIIVDNGSQYHETFEFFSNIQKNKKVRVVKLDIDFNYSKLNNYGVLNAKGDYICLMNNDIGVICDNWLEELLSTAIQPGVGCVGARLWYPNDTIQHAGVFVGYYGVAGHWHRFLKHDDKSYMNRASLQQTISAVTGAVLLIKKSIYEEVGGLEEELAVAFNDIDFCLKVRQKGYRNIYTPFAQMNHYESASRGKDITEKQKLREQQEIDFMKDKYGDLLLSCPHYNPNLSLESENFELAFPPRNNL